MTQVRSRNLVFAAVLGGTIALTVNTVVWSNYEATSMDEYRRLLYEAPVLLDSELVQITRDVMERSMVAHTNKDADAAVAELGEGYAWIGVFDEGYEEMVSGLDTAEQVTRDLYEGAALDNYVGADSRPIAIVGNLGVQVDFDVFENEDGSQEVTKSLNIFEVRDGKLKRLWAFFPTEPKSANVD